MTEDELKRCQQEPWNSLKLLVALASMSCEGELTASQQFCKHFPQLLWQYVVMAAELEEQEANFKQCNANRKGWTVETGHGISMRGW